MKKSYSTPNMFFQPLNIANPLATGDCAFIAQGKEPNAPAKPGPGLLEDGFPMMTVFAAAPCDTTAEDAGLCYTRALNTVFTS